jgi:hypothetical protein
MCCYLFEIEQVIVRFQTCDYLSRESIYLNVNGTVKHGLQGWRIGVSRVFLLVLPPGSEKRFWNEKYWQ